MVTLAELSKPEDMRPFTDGVVQIIHPEQAFIAMASAFSLPACRQVSVFPWVRDLWFGASSPLGTE